jgi:hypothetical protein
VRRLDQFSLLAGEQISEIFFPELRHNGLGYPSVIWTIRAA